MESKPFWRRRSRPGCGGAYPGRLGARLDGGGGRRYTGLVGEAEPFRSVRGDVTRLLAAVAAVSVVAGVLELRRRSVPDSLNGPERTFPDYVAASANVATTKPPAAGELLAALAAFGSDPLARRFAEAFVREPALAGALERMKADGDVERFARELKASPEFAALLRRFGPEPGFPALAESVAASPAVAGALSHLGLRPK